MAKSGTSLTGPVANRQALFSRYGARPSYSKKERTIFGILLSLAVLTIFVTVAIILTLTVDALHFFEQASAIEFLTGFNPACTKEPFFFECWEPYWYPRAEGHNRHVSILPLLAGTMMVAIGSCVVAVPLGLGTAIYLTQYASRRTREILTPIVEVLGGVPTVVYGYFALLTVSPLLDKFVNVDTFNALSASIVVGIAIMPMISSLSVDALSSVPLSIRNAAYALGMRKFHVVVKVIVPAAFSGIVASIILAFSRAVGETMAVTLAAGSTPIADAGQLSYLEQIQTMTAFIVQIVLGDAEAGSFEYYTIFAVGLTLFAMTFSFNYLATRIVRRFEEQYQ